MECKLFYLLFLYYCCLVHLSSTFPVDESAFGNDIDSALKELLDKDKSTEAPDTDTDSSVTEATDPFALIDLLSTSTTTLSPDDGDGDGDDDGDDDADTNDDKKDTSTQNAATWFSKFGYLNDVTEYSTGDDLPQDILTKKIAQLQDFAGLNTTGKLDAPTVKLMNTPRCAMSDHNSKIGKRKKRFILHGSRWDKTELTWMYDMKHQTDDMSIADVRSVMKEAFALWENVTAMKFKEIFTGTPDMIIKFSSSWHGDAYPFDGPGGILAHAFYPIDLKDELSGDLHFDDAEYYTKASAEGKNLLWVATHEIGHAIGIAHSRERRAVMFPWYLEYNPHFTLDTDDITAVHSLYGDPTKLVVQTDAPSKEDTKVKGCADERSECDSWTGAGYCTHQTHKHYMSKYCCKACKDNAQNPMTTKSTTTRDNRTCRDTVVGCVHWAQAGYCVHEAYKQHMDTVCCSSCSDATKKTFTTTTKPGECRDDYPKCPEWKKLDYCSHPIYKRYMMSYCCVTCTQNPL